VKWPHQKPIFLLSALADKWGDVMKSPVVKRSIVLAGHKTSVSLEDAFWMGLKEIAGKRVMSLSDLVGTIDSQRQQGNLSSALRLFVLEFYRSQIPDTETPEGLRQTMDRPNPLPS
jgi:predicted DNA-binding ribbon-helix-helix protein